MVPYNSLNRIHGWINCEKHMKKKKQIGIKKLTNKCPSKERKKFQSTAMKISVNDTQVVTKNVWISRIIIQEKPPHKKSMPVTQHYQPRCEDSLESTEAQLSAEFPWRWRHTCSNFLPRERESRGFLNEIPINRLTLRASSTYRVPCSSCLRLHHNIFPSPLPDNQTLFSH